MKHTELLQSDYGGSDIWKGYAICPKCGSKENWIDGGREG